MIDVVGAARSCLIATARIARSGTIEEQVGEPHQDLVGPAAEVAGDRADDHADDRREERHREADLQRDLPGVQDLGELVRPSVVGAEPVLRARAARLDEQVLLVLRVRREPAAHRSTRRSGRPARRATTTASLCRKNRRRNSCQFERATGSAPGGSSSSASTIAAASSAVTVGHETRILGSSTPYMMSASRLKMITNDRDDEEPRRAGPARHRPAARRGTAGPCPGSRRSAR